MSFSPMIPSLKQTLKNINILFPGQNKKKRERLGTLTKKRFCLACMRFWVWSHALHCSLLVLQDEILLPPPLFQYFLLCTSVEGTIELSNNQYLKLGNWSKSGKMKNSEWMEIILHTGGCGKRRSLDHCLTFQMLAESRQGKLPKAHISYRLQSLTRPEQKPSASRCRFCIHLLHFLGHCLLLNKFPRKIKASGGTPLIRNVAGTCAGRSESVETVNLGMCEWPKG